MSGTPTSQEKGITLSYIKFLQESGKLEAEQLDVVLEILKSAFDLKDGESSAVRLVEIFPAEEEAPVPVDEEKWEEFLKVISDKGYFNGCDEGSAEFAERKEKARAKYIARSNPYEGMSPDQLKSKGNELMQKGQHKTAIGYYSKAIELDATNAVFYANRAAAYTHLNQYSEAVRDCEKATQIKPDYSKAFSRLGTAHFYMQNFAGAVGAFQSAADLEPENEGYKQDLLSAQQKLSAAPAGGMPGGMPGMPGFDFSQMGQMMANPQFQQMAQSVMQNPAFGSMMENMAKNMGGAGGAGGMPDLSQMANMWGGEGGAAGMPGIEGAHGDTIPTPLGNLSRSALEKLQTDAEIKDNPKFQQIQEDIRTKGPMAVMEHMNDPEVMAMMGKFTDLLGSGGGVAPPTEENKQVE